MNFFRFVGDWINTNPGKAVGLFLGLVLGLFILFLGFLKTLFVFLFVAIGYLIGKLKDDKISFLGEFRRFFSRKSSDEDEDI